MNNLYFINGVIIPKYVDFFFYFFLLTFFIYTYLLTLTAILARSLCRLQLHAHTI